MREDIKAIYDLEPELYYYLDIDLNSPDDNRRFYVYEWFTVDPYKVFYVGKGTGKRYAHILKEIELYENNNRKYKGKNYKLIKDKYQIDYKIILDGLTDTEALIMETYYIVKYLRERNPLLNQIKPTLDEATENYWHDVLYTGSVLDYF